MDKRQLTSGSGKSLTITSTGRILLADLAMSVFKSEESSVGEGGGKGDRKWAGFNVGGEEGTRR